MGNTTKKIELRQSKKLNVNLGIGTTKAKDNPPAGTVIGKALSRLDEEVGVVEVLVMMK